MRLSCFATAWLLILLAASTSRAADTSRPVVGPGATKDEVIDAYGWPNGQSRSGTKEILTYPQGQIVLENGRVEKMEFSPNVPWPTPRPRPAPASATTVKKVDRPVDFWVSDFDRAVRDAKERHSRILVLFTGSDWSPASKQFHDEVEFHPDFVNTFAGEFVFLRLDFPTRTPQSPELKVQNARLREKYGVTTYPALLILSADGAAVAAIDLTKPQAGANYRERVINAIRETRDLLVVNPPAAEAGTPSTAPQPTATPTGMAAFATALGSARQTVLFSFVIGVAIAGFLLWLVWRRRTVPVTPPVTSLTDRISDAASGLPKLAEIAAWPKERVCAVAAALAESNGFAVEDRQASGDADIALKRPGDAQPRVLVCCAAAGAGVVPAKRVRELFATLTAEGVATGWFVAPGGFAPDAAGFAEQNGLVLIDAERLLSQLRDLPPLILPKVLARRVV